MPFACSLPVMNALFKNGMNMLISAQQSIVYRVLGMLNTNS